MSDSQLDRVQAAVDATQQRWDDDPDNADMQYLLEQLMSTIRGILSPPPAAAADD